LKAAWFCAYIRYLSNINSGESNIHPEYRQDHHAVFWYNWHDAVCSRKTDILCFEPVRQGPNQSGKEEKKDWLFEEVVVAFSCPPLRLLGRSPFSDIFRVCEGAPLFSLTYLANFTPFFHHLF
jgi:hypothetical protein